MFEQSLLIQVGIGVSVHFLLAFPIRSGSFITCTARMENLNGALRFSHFHVGRIHESFNASQKMIDHLHPGIPAARMPHASTLHEQPPDVSMDPLRISDLISQQGSRGLVMCLNNANAHSSTRAVSLSAFSVSLSRFVAMDRNSACVVRMDTMDRVGCVYNNNNNYDSYYYYYY